MSCRCPRKRPLNETPRKGCQKRPKAPPDVSVCHLNKHRLINSLGVFVTETRLGHANPQVVLPPKISHSTELRGGACHRLSKTSGGEDLQIEEPVCGGYSSAFHFHATLPGMLSSTLIRDEVVQVC